MLMANLLNIMVSLLDLQNIRDNVFRNIKWTSVSRLS